MALRQSSRLRVVSFCDIFPNQFSYSSARDKRLLNRDVGLSLSYEMRVSKHSVEHSAAEPLQDLEI